MAGAGYTPEEIDAMPAQDAAALLRHWRTRPPTNEIVAAAFGLQPAPERDPDDPSGIGGLIGRHPDGAVR